VKLRLNHLRKKPGAINPPGKARVSRTMIAGIAHEIKPADNFVNNFSAVSKELLAELKDAKTENEKKNRSFN